MRNASVSTTRGTIMSACLNTRGFATLLISSLVLLPGCFSPERIAPRQLTPELLALPSSIYVADTGNNRIVHIASMFGDGQQFLSGSGNNTFSQPTGITAWQGRGYHTRFDLPSYKLYVVDRSNHRVVRLDNMNGDNWQTLGSLGNGASQFSRPARLAKGFNSLWVTDVGNSRFVEMSDPDPSLWEPVRVDTDLWAGLRGGCFQNPGVGAATDGMGIAHRLGHVYLSTAQWVVKVDRLSESEQIAPCIDDRQQHFGPWNYFAEVCCFDADGNSRFLVRSETGAVVRASAPRGIAIGRRGEIYVADTGNDRIVRFDNMTGAGWTELRQDPGGKGDSIKRPSAVALDSSGGIYIADTGNNRIVYVKDMSGTGWTTCCTSPTGGSLFAGPMDVYVGPGPR